MGAAMLLRAVCISKHKRNATDEHLSSALQCAIDHVLNGASCVYQLWQDKVLDVCNSEQTSRRCIRPSKLVLLCVFVVSRKWPIIAQAPTLPGFGLMLYLQCNCVCVYIYKLWDSLFSQEVRHI